jgi:hypothetical protein
MTQRNRNILVILAVILVIFLAKNYMKNLFTSLDKTQNRIEQGLGPIDATPEQVRNRQFSQGVHVEIRGVSENCQARVVQDGVVIFANFLDLGESRVFEARREVRVKAMPGNCLEIAANGLGFVKPTTLNNTIEKTFLPQSR